MRPTESIALRREPGHLIRSLVALILRGGLGMILLMAGLDKLRDMDAPLAEALEDLDDVVADRLDDDEATDDDEAPASDADGESRAEGEAAPPDLSDEGVPPEVQPEAAPPPRYPDSSRGMFADTWLARDFEPALELHTALLPYLEIGVGALLILGLFTTLWAFVGGLLLLSLLFGQIVLGNTAMYPNMLLYLLIDVGILWLSPVTSNYLSLDGLLFGWFWKPKDEGEYRREYEAPGRRA